MLFRSPADPGRRRQSGASGRSPPAPTSGALPRPPGRRFPAGWCRSTPEATSQRPPRGPVSAWPSAPRGLIRYTSTNRLAGLKTRLLRPKTLAYGAVLCVAALLFALSITGKSDLDVNILRDRNVLARKISGGRIQNIYTVKILNKTEHPRRYTLSVAGIAGAEIDGKTHLSVDTGAVSETVLRVNVPRKNLTSTNTL